MDVREFVIRLVLDAMGFRRQVESVQHELDNLGQSGGRAAREAGAGVDDLSRAAAAAGTELRDVGRQAHRAGEQAAQGAQKSSSAWGQFGETVAKVTAFFGGAALIGGAVSSYTQEVNAISNMSSMLGMSMEEWQGWQEAAKQTGIDAENLGTRMADLGDWMQDLALHESGPLADAVKDMGVSFTDASGNVVSLEEGMLRLAAATEGMDRQKATSLLTQMGFDEQTIPLIIKGRKGVEELVRAGKEAAIYSERDRENARKMSEAWNGLTKIWAAASGTLMRILGPAFEWMASAFSSFAGWVRKNEDSIKVYLAAIAGVIAVALTPALWGMASAAWAAIAPFLPFIALIAGLALVIDDLIVYIQGGESALSDFWSIFGTGEEILARLQAMWEGLKTAIGAVLDIVKALVGWFAALLNGDLQGMIDQAWKLWEAFKSLGNVLGNLIGWLGEKLAGLLPDWAKDLLGLSGGGEEKANAAQAAAAGGANAKAAFDMAATGGVGSPAAMPQPYNAAALPPASPAALGPAGGQTVNNSKQVTTTVTVGEINVQSNSADPNAVAQAVPNALSGQVAQAATAYGT